MRNIITDFIETFCLSLIIIFSIYTFVASIEVVSGSSMEPNFYTNERILVDKVSKHFRAFQRGDIVVLTPPDNRSVHFIKRILGVPGDIVKIYDCRLYITRDGTQYLLQEPYLAPELCTSGGTRIRDGWSLRIPEGKYMVLGDNRGVSIDSRYFGLVTKEELVGHVLFRFWPIVHLGFTH